MKKNKEYLLTKIMETTKFSKEEAEIIINILDSHFIIGHNNKEKIKNDFISKLNIDERTANDLYNTCSGIIVKNIFKR